jgi:hypothetical protein
MDDFAKGTSSRSTKLDAAWIEQETREYCRLAKNYLPDIR